MKIDGPKFNNFTNIDNDLLETNKKDGKSVEGNLSIGLEVKQLSSTESGKGKFKDLSTSESSDRPLNRNDLASMSRSQDDLLGASLLKLPPGLQKKFSGEFPKVPGNNNNQTQTSSNSGIGNNNQTQTSSNGIGNNNNQTRPSSNGIGNNGNNRPIQQDPATSSDFLRSQFQNSVFRTTGNDISNNNRTFPSPINRPNANDLPLPNNKGNKVKSGSFNIPKELSTTINQPIEQSTKAGNLFNQKDAFKETFKAENKPDRGLDKPNPKSGKPIDQTSTNNSSSPVDEVETTLEIEITQSIEVSSDQNDVSNENDIIRDNSDNSRIGRGRGGRDVTFSTPQNNNIPSANDDISLTEPATELETAVANVVSRLASKDLAQTAPLSQLPENIDVENIALTDTDEASLNAQNNFASTLKLSSSGLLANQLDLINSALDDISNSASLLPSQLDKTTTNSTGSTNKTNVSELIAASNTKALSIPVGQSLEQVANELGIDVFDLLKANPQLLKDPLLFAGQRVRIPNTQELAGNLPANSLTSNASTLLENQLGKNLSQLPLEQTKANIGISSLPTQSELAKASLSSNAELNANAISVKSDKNLHAAHHERTIDPSTAKPEIKHTEPLAPGFGIFGNREIEIEVDDDRPQSRRKFNLPEPFDEWADHIYNAADKYKIDASLIASLIWCESAGKNLVGKNGHGHGLMQIDDRRYKQWLKANEDGLNPATNIDFGVSILRKNIDYFRGKLSAGIAAYDCGIDLVEETLVVGKDVDFFTTDKNYSFRILAQQDYFRRFFD